MIPEHGKSDQNISVQYIHFNFLQLKSHCNNNSSLLPKVLYAYPQLQFHAFGYTLFINQTRRTLSRELLSN
jgi:hypothetical protein